MFYNERVDIEKAVKLELWLFNNIDKNLSREDAGKLFFNKFKYNDAVYLLDAYLIPIGDVIEKIKIYDNMQHKDINFVYNMEKEYDVDRVTIFNRWEYGRSIMSYLSNHPDIELPNTKFYDKLVRNNVPRMIESGGYRAIYYEASDNEYIDYLYKKDIEESKKLSSAINKEDILDGLADKLEVIRSLAKCYGFSIRDVLEYADNKNIINGSYSNKYILKKKYNNKNKS